MGGSRRGSSSKTKSSKRKRDKISSKKKSRREEPKKRRRVLDSVTSDSDNYSLNSKHSSSSTSESDHRRRIKRNKKRLRASLSSYSDYESVSSDSDSDYDNKSRKAQRSKVGFKDTKRSGKRYTSPSDRKRKRLDRDCVRKKVKKSSKKKSRKYSSISSSSDSESCSTGQSRSGTSTEDCKSKAILNKDIERPRGKESHGGKKKRKVSPSFDGGSHPSVGVSNADGRSFPRRLKSVIAVVNPPNNDEGDNRWEMDLHKEEIVYDQNDYPSPKSVDSNEGGGRMESSKDSHGAFNERICVENVADEEVGKSLIDCMKEKETDVSVPEAGGDLLESILRQRALENLRKFKGRIQTGLRSSTDKMNDEIDMDGQNKLIDQDKRDERSGLSLGEEICLNKLPNSEEDPPNATAVLECSKEDIPVSRSDSGPGTSGANDCTVESSSSVGPVSGEHSLEQGNGAKDGSQFEEKTMSVMRGGELVQVSYKVYIPKKAPGLARRQLRR